VNVDGIGAVERWVDVTEISWPLVTFRGTWRFHTDGAVLTSNSTLCFRERTEIEADLTRHGFTIAHVRGAPDRPGREFVFIARRSVTTTQMGETAQIGVRGLPG